MKHCQTRSRNHPRFAEKIAEGATRNERWANLTTSAKVAELRKRRGFSKRQQTRLIEQD